MVEENTRHKQKRPHHSDKSINPANDFSISVTSFYRWHTLWNGLKLTEPEIADVRSLIPYIGKVCWGEVRRINRSANRLLIVSIYTNLDGVGESLQTILQIRQTRSPNFPAIRYCIIYCIYEPVSITLIIFIWNNCLPGVSAYIIAS